MHMYWLLHTQVLTEVESTTAFSRLVHGCRLLEQLRRLVEGLYTAVSTKAGTTDHVDY